MRAWRISICSRSNAPLQMRMYAFREAPRFIVQMPMMTARKARYRVHMRRLQAGNELFRIELGGNGRDVLAGVEIEVHLAHGQHNGHDLTPYLPTSDRAICIDSHRRSRSKVIVQSPGIVLRHDYLTN
jgi:hypothetical protein